MKLHYLQKVNKNEILSRILRKELFIFVLLTFSTLELFAQPVITSNGGGATASISVPENTTTDLPLRVVTTVIATPGFGTTTFSISGGVDAAKFSMTSGGVLSFTSTIDYENPGDADLNNQYIVIVRATDQSVPTPLYTEQIITVIVNNVNEAPVFTGASAPGTVLKSIPENSTSVITVTATDPEGSAITYTIATGLDGAKFSVNAVTGALSFISAPDFESPNDLYAPVNNNVYGVVVQASDGVNKPGKLILVTVTDVNDAPTNITLSNNIVAENQPVGTTVGNLTSTDQDVGNTFTYTIQP